MKPRIDRFLHLPLDHPQAEIFKAELRRPNPALANAKNLGFSTYGISPYITEYTESLQTGTLILPRSYVNSLNEPYDDHTVPGLRVHFGAPIKLRPYQVEPADTITKALLEKKHGILQSPPGSGKTVIGLEVARRIGRKVGVLVHTSFLMNQWAERAQEFLPGAKVGFVQGDQCDYDADIVIMMLQSLNARTYPKELYERIGLLVSDEVHRTAAETFKQAVVQFPAQYRLGLTATPYRLDELEWIFFGHLGKIEARAAIERANPKVYVVPSNLRVANMGPLMLNGRQNLSKVINHVADSAARSRQVVSLVTDAAAKKRRVIVFSDRRQHLVDMAEMFKEQCARKGVRATFGFFVGGMTEKDRAIASERQVIFSTYQFACLDLQQEMIDFVSGRRSTLQSVISDDLPIYVTDVESGLACVSCSPDRRTTGRKESLVVKTPVGELRCSPDHRLLTERGWLVASDLSVGDSLARPDRLDFGPVVDTDLTDDDCYLLGALIGDGSLSQVASGSMNFVNADPDIVEAVNRGLIARGLSLVPKGATGYKYRIKGGGRQGTGVKTWLRQVVEEFGLAVTARDKHIPSQLMLGAECGLAHAVAGLFDTDGSISSRRGEISFSSVSTRLATQVQGALWRLGIHSSCKQDTAGMYLVRVFHSDADRFASTIPLRSRRKRGLLRNFVDTRGYRGGPVGSYPVSATMRFKQALKDGGVAHEAVFDHLRSVGMGVAWLRQGYRRVRREVFEEAVRWSGVGGEILEDFQAFRWVKVESVEPAGVVEMGDLYVPGINNYLAGGVVVHNSEGLDIADLDTCVLATPKSDIIQTVGRIQRVVPGKKDPIVIDVVDFSIGLCQGLYRKRQQQYQAQSWEVKMLQSA